MIPQALRTTVLPMTNLLIAVMLTTALDPRCRSTRASSPAWCPLSTRAPPAVSWPSLVSALAYVGSAFVIGLVGNRIDKKVRILR